MESMVIEELMSQQALKKSHVLLQCNLVIELALPMLVSSSNWLINIWIDSCLFSHRLNNDSQVLSGWEPFVEKQKLEQSVTSSLQYLWGKCDQWKIK